jgi:hypothetical protein
MSDFRFVGPTYVAASITQNDEECVNWYVEQSGADFAGSPTTGQPAQRGATALYPTPGLVQQIGQTTNPAGGAPIPSPLGTLGARGFRVIPGGQALIAVYGATLYVINTAFTATAVGTLLSNAGPVSISDNGVSAYLCDGAQRYSYTWGTNAFAQVNDGGFLGGSIVDIVDGFLVYTNPGTNQFGATTANSTASPGLSFGTKFSAPDNVMSLQVVNRDLYIIGEKTTEVYTDAGLFPFPFQIIAGTSMQHGTIAPYSVSRLGEGFAMLSQDTRGQAVVVEVSGYKPTRISTHAVENALNQYSVLGDAIGMTYQAGGHEFYMLTFPTADITWVYDLATQLWHKRAYMDANGVLHRHRANCLAYFAGQIVVGDFQTGTLYTFSQTTYTDAGNPIPCIRRAPHVTTDLKRQFFHDLQIQFQPGVGLQIGQGADPQAMLRWSDDGGSTFSSIHTASIGRVGKYKNRAIWRRLGQARDRIFEVTVTDPVFRVVVSANLNASAAAN